MGPILPLVLALLTATPGAAQIFAVKLNSPKAEKRYAKHLAEVHGESVVLGEMRSGVEWDAATHNSKFNIQGRSEWFVCDPSDPLKLPYKVKNGMIGKANKRQVLGIQNADIAQIRIYAQRTSWYGVSLEYQGRVARLEQLQEERDTLEAGTKDWDAAQAALLDQATRTADWLSSWGFGKAADKLLKQKSKWEKAGAAVRADARRQLAMKGIGAAEDAVKMTATAVENAPGRSFRRQGSQHCLIQYHTGISDQQVAQVLELAENAILGFRAEFVDPYLGDDFPDRLPEGRFVEWYFGPDDAFAHEHMFENHFGLSWGPRKAERMQSQGNMVRRGGQDFLFYWRIGPGEDLPGIIANNLGVALATLNYSQFGSQVPTDWVEEAVGYWVSLEFLGRNVVTNKEFQFEDEDEGRTVGGKGEKKPGQTVADSVALTGERSVYLQVALEDGSPLHALMTTELFDMENGDLAKSWAMFDFLARRTGREGQLFLRAMGEAARDRSSFHSRLREIGDRLFDIHGQDVFRVLDERWQEYAREQLRHASD